MIRIALAAFVSLLAAAPAALAQGAASFPSMTHVPYRGMGPAVGAKLDAEINRALAAEEASAGIKAD